MIEKIKALLFYALTNTENDFKLAWDAVNSINDYVFSSNSYMCWDKERGILVGVDDECEDVLKTFSVSREGVSVFIPVCHIDRDMNIRFIPTTHKEKIMNTISLFADYVYADANRYCIEDEAEWEAKVQECMYNALESCDILKDRMSLYIKFIKVGSRHILN